MQFKFEVTSIHPQAKNWILAGIKRHLEGETKQDILKACKKTAKELKLTVKYQNGTFVFSDKQLIQ
jgi:hypothetical protein